jgi:hypothetical protein
MFTRLIAAASAALFVTGCTATIGGAGPPGAPGPAGPRGAQFAQPLFANADVTVNSDTDVVVARTALMVTLPKAQDAGRLITVRAAGGDVVVRAAAGERVERSERFALEDGEMATFMADGAVGWFVISSSDL